MSLHINKLFRLRPLRSSILRQPALRRTEFNDASRPFPPPQPTRPIDMLDDANKKESVMSPTMDAVVEDILLHSDKYSDISKRSHHFDTYDLLMHLENQGFTRRQAEVIMKGIKFRLREWYTIIRTMHYI
jgi:hypothetical protein